VVSLTSSSGGYINGRNSANLELLIDETSSIYLYVKLKALASWIFLSFTSCWRNSDSYEYKNKSARILRFTVEMFRVLRSLISFCYYISLFLVLVFFWFPLSQNITFIITFQNGGLCALTRSNLQVLYSNHKLHVLSIVEHRPLGYIFILYKILTNDTEISPHL
jgi:hypothetical protein